MKEKYEMACVIDMTGEVWDAVIDDMLAHSAHIIALRGAGEFSGISIADANRILKAELIPRVEAYLLDGPVSIIYDGDDDNPQYPDVGHIMSRLSDHFGDRVNFYSVQKFGWYKYDLHASELKALHSALGNEYSTVLFPDNLFSGDHNYFSQHARLACSRVYEQWYVGACGSIAVEQLSDFGEKVQDCIGVHRVTAFRLPVSIERGQKMEGDLAMAEDDEIRARLASSLEERKQKPFGLLYNQKGEFIDLPQYKLLHILVV